MKKYFIYARKSTESEDRQILSIESQINELKELAKRKGLEVSEVLEESKSAKAPGRPIYSDMLKRIYNKEADGIICWKLDRLARNPIDGGQIIWALKELDIEIITPTQMYQSGDDNQLIMYMEFGMAQKYIDDLSKNVKRGNKTKYEKGWVCGMPPLGYLNDRINRTIITDPIRFPLVRKIWDLALTNCYSLRELSEKAEEMRLTSRKCGNYPGGYPSISTIHKILTNPFYYGELHTTQGIYRGSQEPMIKPEEFDKVQSILGRKGKPRPIKKRFAYTGLIRCGECGCQITAETKVQRHGHQYTYYRCTKRKGACSQKYIELKDLEAQMVDILEDIRLDPEFITWSGKYLSTKSKREFAERGSMIRNHQEDYNQAQKLLDELLAMRLNRLLGDEEFLEQKTKLMQEKDRIQKMLRDDNNRADDWFEKVGEMFKIALEAVDAINNGSIEVKRQVLDSIGSNLVLKDKKLALDMNKPYSQFFRSQNKSDWLGR